MAAALLKFVPIFCHFIFEDYDSYHAASSSIPPHQGMMHGSSRGGKLRIRSRGDHRCCVIMLNCEEELAIAKLVLSSTSSGNLTEHCYFN